MDNATTTTMVAELQKQVPAIEENKPLRWAGHIINLVIKAILYGEGVQEFHCTIVEASDAQQSILWRKFEKIRNTVKYTMRCDQHRQYFLSGQTSSSDDLLFDHSARLLMKGLRGALGLYISSDATCGAAERRYHKVSRTAAR